MKRSMIPAILVVALTAMGSLVPAAATDPACAGARQVEDPISPPCAAPFTGDNGGATATGVTATEITVVLYSVLGIKGDLNLPYQPSDERRLSQVSYSEMNLVRTAKAQLRYFLQHFQTYGRTVHVVAFPASTGGCPLGEYDASTIISDIHPFAVLIDIDGFSLNCFRSAMSAAGVPTFGLDGLTKRSTYDSEAPFAWGVFPDLDTQTAYSASFICRSLRGEPARLAGDPRLAVQTRKFGFIAPVDGVREELQASANKLEAAVQDACGMTFDATATYNHQDITAAGLREAPGIMQDFQTQGITTIVCYCIPVLLEETVEWMQAAATALGYAPEWYWDSASFMDRSVWTRTSSNHAQHSFGVTYWNRQPAFHDQYHYRAYVSQEPGTSPNARIDYALYGAFMELFTAVQLTGPTLTAANMATALHAYAVRSTDPFIGSGAYDDASTPQSFVDTAAAWVWDPTGVSPDGVPGCFRAADGGERFTAGTWPASDSFLGAAGDPCTNLEPWQLVDV